MGYSGRYHAASLAAVFIALAIGILIGIGLADDVVSGASDEIEESLRSDLDATEQRAEDLQGELDREAEFSARVAPALVADRLDRRRVALIAFGGLDAEIAADVREAVGAAGAPLESVAVIATPPDIVALTEIAGPRFASARRDEDALAAFAEALGRQLVGGGPLIGEELRSELFSEFSGDLSQVDEIVLARLPGELLEEDQAVVAQGFESGLIRGIESAAEGLVAVERSETDPTTLEPFAEAGLTTVDHLGTPSGQVALVFGLLGAEGRFGTKEGAVLLPQSLGPPTEP